MDSQPFLGKSLHNRRPFWFFMNRTSFLGHTEAWNDASVKISGLERRSIAFSANVRQRSDLLIRVFQPTPQKRDPQASAPRALMVDPCRMKILKPGKSFPHHSPSDQVDCGRCSPATFIGTRYIVDYKPLHPCTVIHILRVLVSVLCSYFCVYFSLRASIQDRWHQSG